MVKKLELIASKSKPSGWGNSRFIEGRTTPKNERLLKELAEAIEQPDLPNSYSRHMAIAAGLTGLVALVEGCTTTIYPAGAPIIRYGYGVPYHNRPGYHNGIDIDVRIGHPVLAGADGLVIFSGWDCCGGGNTISIEHGKDEDGNYLRTVYVHNDKNLVEKGEKVKRGQKIALSGFTGEKVSDFPHLHFGVYKGKTPIIWDNTWEAVNPDDYLINNRITCFEPGKMYVEKPIRFTYPVECKR